LNREGKPSRFFYARKRFFRRRNDFFRPCVLTGRVVRHGNNKTNMAANNRLKAARVLKGITQLQLAEMVGLKEIEVSRFETGRRTPSQETKQRIATVLGKPTFELFEA
jgi:DNA-binding XRE family transcriptional regulator